jgi:hypothetical protein
MAAPGRHALRPRTVLVAVGLAFLAGSAPAQNLPWEVTVAEIESGRLRALAERLSKQNLLYQFRLGDIRKSDLVETAARIDRILESLQQGDLSYSVPAPWTPELREQLRTVDAAWGSLRRIAVASPYDRIRVSRDFVPAESRRGDPLLVRYFDDLSLDLVRESEKLLDLYHAECLKTGLEICDAARTSGLAAMVIERATKQAIYVVVGVDVEQNKARLKQSVEAYLAIRKANNQSDFYAEALNPERGPSAKAAGQLLESLRQDWDALQAEISLLAAGDESNFDLRELLDVEDQLVGKVERLTAALVRYASLTYGS